MTETAWERVKRELVFLLELPEAERGAALARLHDDDAALARDVESLLSPATNADFLETPAPSRFLAPRDPPAVPPARIGPWRIEEEIGRGGMGTVYRARRDDGTFEQTVAIKLVRPELSSELLRRRFLAERRILATLEHPNIARVLDGGATEQGVPYLVLEHVAGQPVDLYADARALAIEERLRLFVRICGAVHHAHQKLVLHRDIKAANVLVDASGEPKLLDFGIAKLLTPEPTDADLTSLGLARPLTPEWASPEQLRGEPLTTASDVYSLGVLLFTLLSGRRPKRYTGESVEAFAASIAASPAPTLISATGGTAARGVDRRRLHGDVDRIARKALDPDPGRRYATVFELSADVERFLQGRAVEAHPDGFGYRLSKWLGRHRAAAAATLLVAASLLGATAFSLRQAGIAERERVRAQRRFDDVRRLANVVLFDVQDALVNVSGALTARRLLVENALRYLDDLAREAGDEPELLAELAAAYERIAELQGMPNWPSEGRTGNALASLTQALELRRRLSSSAPETDATRLAEARLLVQIGSVLAGQGDTVAARKNHLEGEAILTALLVEKPTADLQRELAVAQVAIGDDHWELGEMPGAILYYEKALRAASAARAAEPNLARAVRQVGVIEQRLGDVAAETGDWPRAETHHRASLAIDEELLRREPENLEVERDLGTDLSRIAEDAIRSGDLAAAKAANERAVELRERLLAQDPGDARALEDAAESRFQKALIVAAMGRPGEAATVAGPALERWRSLVALDPDNARWRIVLAAALSEAARWEAQNGKRGRALAVLAEAITIRSALEKQRPGFGRNKAQLEEAQAMLETVRAGKQLPAPERSLAPWN